MPIIKSAQKKMRQDEKRYVKNLRIKRELRQATKEFKKNPTFDGLKKLQSKIDTAVKKNILKKNTGARRIAQMSKIAKDSGVKIPVAKKAAAKPATKTTTKASASKKTTAAKKTTAKK